MESKTYLLSVELVDRTGLLRKYDAARVDCAVGNFRETVASAAGEFGGLEGGSSTVGCWYIFRGTGSANRAVWAGMSLLARLAVFNQREERNPLPEPLLVRVAAGVPAPGSGPRGTEPGLAPSSKVRAQLCGTRAGSFSIDAGLYQALGPRVRGNFQAREKSFPGQGIYYFSAHEARRPPSRQGLSRLAEEVEVRCQSVLKILLENPLTDLEGFLAVEANRSLQEIYERIFFLLRACCDVRSFWSKDYTQQVGDTAERLLALEEDLRTRLAAWFSEHELETWWVAELDRIQTVLNFHHAEVRAGLHHVMETTDRQVQSISGEILSAATGIYGRVEELIRLSRETTDCAEIRRLETFIRTVHHERNELTRLLAGELTAVQRGKIQRALWPYADLIVAEDLRVGSLGSAAHVGLIDSLAGPSPHGRLFEELSRALARDQPPDAGPFERLAGAAGISLDPEVVRRSLVMGHANPGVRFLAAQDLEIRGLWKLVAYQRSPLRALSVCAGILNGSSSPDERKIFFDAIRARLHHAIEVLKPGAEIPEIEALVKALILFDTFSQPRYFRFLELLVRHLEGRLALFHTRLSAHLDRSFRALSGAPPKGEPQGPDLPRGIHELPPGMRLCLARQGYYVAAFAFDEADPVARETVDFIGPSTFPSIVSYGEERPDAVLNGAFDEGLRSRVRFSAADQEILSGLRHPGRGAATGPRRRLWSPHLQTRIDDLLVRYRSGR